MNLEKLYKMQEGLDNHILENARKRNVVMSEEELLEKTILAMQVEVAELANATRCFKHWSTKGPENKERLLDELADVWHFYLSVGNQLNSLGHKVRVLYTFESMFKKEYEGKSIGSLSVLFTQLLQYIPYMNIEILNYINEERTTKIKLNKAYEFILTLLYLLARELDFADKEVEQAYLKKHEENYRRQREGY